MKILGIETSCDETAAAVVENGQDILSNVVVSQIDIFAEYGGVIPEVAARSHLEVINPVIDKALKDAHCTWGDIDAIAVTHAPGLLGSLLIGTLAARTLAILHQKPLYAVHHLKSHVYANWLKKAVENTFSQQSAGASGHFDNGHGRAAGTEIPGQVRLTRCKNDDCEPRTLRKGILNGTTFPLLALVISGGHTQILYMSAHNHFEIIGTTKDDAIGECFDKVAKILGLPYPGGPSIAKAAATGDPHRYHLPHPKVAELDFSFSGLKTAVLRAVQSELGLSISHPSHDLKNHLTPQQIADFAASFQQTAVDILLEKLKTALAKYPDVSSVVFAGGVSANQELRRAVTLQFGGFGALAARSPLGTRERSEELAREPRGDESERRDPECGVTAYFPEPKFSGDNGAMVASAAYYEILSGVQPADPYSLDIYPRISIEI